MLRKTLTNPSVWIALVLLVANGALWAYALAPEAAAVVVEARLEPDIADLRQRLIEGGHGGELFYLEVTELEAAETIAWYLKIRPSVPFRDPQVSIEPDGISAEGVAEIAGLRVRLMGRASIDLQGGVPIVSLADLDVAGLAVPAFVQRRIQAEIDAQFSLAQNLPLVVDELVLEEGKVIVRGTIR